MYEICENKLFLKDTMKKVIWYFPLHPVTFYEQNVEKQNRPQLVLALPFESGNWKEKGKKWQKIE